MAPYGAFWALASVLGIVLVVVGMMHIVAGDLQQGLQRRVVARRVGGLLEVFIGFWISAQSPRAQAVFVIIWAGLLALFRGIFGGVLAFEVRSAQTQPDRAVPDRAAAHR